MADIPLALPLPISMLRVARTDATGRTTLRLEGGGEGEEGRGNAVPHLEIVANKPVDKMNTESDCSVNYSVNSRGHVVKMTNLAAPWGSLYENDEFCNLGSL